MLADGATLKPFRYPVLPTIVGTYATDLCARMPTKVDIYAIVSDVTFHPTITDLTNERLHEVRETVVGMLQKKNHLIDQIPTVPTVVYRREFAFI